MSDFFAVYLKNPKSKDAYVKFLREKALSLGVQYVLYPKLYEFPKCFQEAKFGIEYPNFLGILYCPRGAINFPDELSWPGIILSHLYTQETEADDWIRRKTIGILNRSALSGVKRPPPDSFERKYERPNKYQRWMREEDELNVLIEEHKSRKEAWKRAHWDEIQRAWGDKKRLDMAARKMFNEQLNREYDAYLRQHPGLSRKEKVDYFDELLERKHREYRYHPALKYGYDLYYQFMDSAPHKSEELKNRIKKHKLIGEMLHEQKCWQ